MNPAPVPCTMSANAFTSKSFTACSYDFCGPVRGWDAAVQVNINPYFASTIQAVGDLTFAARSSICFLIFGCVSSRENRARLNASPGLARARTVILLSPAGRWRVPGSSSVTHSFVIDALR